jgi:hypothetical protein
VTVAKALRICRKASHRFNFTANLFAIAPPEHFFALQYSRRLSMELEVVPLPSLSRPNARQIIHLPHRACPKIPKTHLTP